MDFQAAVDFYCIIWVKYPHFILYATIASAKVLLIPEAFSKLILKEKLELK